MIIATKRIGETPLACLERIRVEQGISADVPMTYAGRLDPMAEGILILLEGDECKEKEKYTGLDKTYEFEILVGFETDTYDLLGMVEQERLHPNPLLNKKKGLDTFQNVLQSFIGKQEQYYPMYSSKTVGGKQLHTLAREGVLSDLVKSGADFVRPTHQIEIFSLTMTDTKIISKKKLLYEITERISKVLGDFRQQEILKRWSEVLQKSPQNEFQIFSCTMDCGTGTYVRQLVHDIGTKLGMPCVTYSIKRIKVGEYQMVNEKL